MKHLPNAKPPARIAIVQELQKQEHKKSAIPPTMLAENQSKILKLRVNNKVLAKEKEDLEVEVSMLT